MNTVLVTGANAGLGFETCRQLAAEKDVCKIILGCRNETKAHDAIDRLVELTGKPKSTFGFMRIDTTDSDSCREAVASLETPLDGVVLNAGGMATGDLMKDGSLMGMAMNLIGHAVFVQAAIKANKLAPKARIVFSGSEAARGIPYLRISAPEYEKEDTASIRKIITGEKRFDENLTYAYIKSLGALYMSSMARKYPNYYFVTISPGMTSGTEAVAKAGFFKRMIFTIAYFVLSKHVHQVDSGAARYLTGLYGDKDKYPSGSFFASEKSTTTGDLANQKYILPNVFGNVKLEDNVYDALQEFVNYGV